MKMTRVAAVAALAPGGARVRRARLRSGDDARRADRTRGARLALHRVLARALSRPLGLFEPMALSLDDLPTAQAQSLEARLAALDPSAGGSAGPGRRRAGAGLGHCGLGHRRRRPRSAASTSSTTRARGAGLSQSGGLASLGNTLGLLLDASSGFRALFTGTPFNMTGRPSTEWLRAPENDVGLDAFHAGLEAAIAGDRPQRRATALARALLALGGVLTILEDAGEPAHVRNDFRQRLPRRRGGRARSIAARRSSGSSRRPTGGWACPPRSRRSGVRR